MKIIALQPSNIISGYRSIVGMKRTYAFKKKHLDETDSYKKQTTIHANKPINGKIQT